KRQTQNDALKIAQQQSKRQTQSDALKVAQQQSQKQTQQQAAKAAAQQLKAMAKPNAAKKKPQKQKTMDDVSPLSVAAPELNPLEAAITGITPDEIQAPFNEPSDDNPVVGIPVEVVPLEAVPTAPKVVPPHGGNTTGSQNEENYPKPRDVAFVFPDQSVSIAIPHRRSRAKVLFAAGFLFLIAVVGMVAFIMQRGPAPAENGTEIANEAVVPIPEPKEKMLHIEFPTTYSFGVLYDPEEQRASDDWPSYAKAQGTVEYVEGKKFHIVIQQEHADNLAPLTTIPPNTISSLRLPDMELTEAVLQNLWQLKGLKILSIDKIISDEEKSKVKNGFSYDVMVTSRDPNEVVRAQTSPGVRTLSFPTDASVGRIAIRKWQKTDQMWQHFELALGDVEIPANMEIQMEISKDVTDLGFLAALQDESNRTVLHSLILSGSSINDTSMEGVSTLKTLYGLEMLQTNVTAAGMNKLIGIRGLEHLKIDGTKLPNDGFEVLKELINLKRVEIYNAPNVTIGILPVFKQLRSLKRLHLENTGITSEQRRQIDTEIDKCTVSPLL
ncbi:MAG: hypothetical protein KAH38_02385, partial [Candidatus Hydrogenedentes bacterium]|nr:hypothetical protein [Candidatus Hydrogenedentota bacterium]